MKNPCIPTLLVSLLLWGATAVAEPDTFGLGTGRNGTLRVTKLGTVINRYSQVTTPLAPGDTVLLVSSTEGFAAGDLILVLQTTGIVPEPTRGEQGPISLSRDPVGQWELARVTSVDGQELQLGAPLTHSYAGLVTQVIRVPEYTDVKIEAGASLSAAPWDGSQGGLLVFLVNGLIQNDGVMEANGAGFRGGMAPEEPTGFSGCATLPAAVRVGAGRGEGISSLDFGTWAKGLENAANGGGGGLCPKAGGGGGGNGAEGGKGGDSWTLGDSARDIGGRGGAGLVYSLSDHLTLGGGGGQGYGGGRHSQGGTGGGAIFVRAQHLAGSGAILAHGSAGENATQGGAGGGGAGGSISLRIADFVECGLISAQGGRGGSSSAGTLEFAGPGGGGGGGRVLYQAARTGTCAVSVDAGLAGDLTGASPRTGDGAQPTAIQLPSHRGIITRIESGFEKSLATCDLPGPVFTMPRDGDSVNFRPTFRGTVTAAYTAGDKVKVAVGPSGYGDATVDVTNLTWSYTYQGTSLINGVTYSVKAVGDCKTGGTSSNVTTINVTADTIGPLIAWVEPLPPNPLYADHTTFHVKTTNENKLVTFRCTLDNATAIEDCGTGKIGDSVPLVLNGLSEGSHTLKVTAVDAAGNSTSNPIEHTWEVILIPVVEITQKPVNPTSARVAEFHFNASISGSTFQCKLDNEDWANCSSPYTRGNLSDNTHTFQVKAATSKREGDPTVYVWVVDTLPPNTRLDSKPPSVSNDRQPEFTFAAEPAEPGVTFECALDSFNYFPCTSPWRPSSYLTHGSHNFAVRAKDRASNVDPSPESYTWMVDLEAPNTRLTGKPPDPSNNLHPEFTFEAIPDEQGVTFECALDSANFSTCTSPWVPSTELQTGNHRFEVRVKDALGNVDSTPDIHTWMVDITAPSTTLEGTPPDPSNDSTPTFSFIANEQESTFKCRVQPAEFVPCTSPWTSPPLSPDVPHTFEVKATDKAGNEAATAASYTWTLDMTAPALRIVRGPPQIGQDRTAEFEFASDSDWHHYECVLSDNGPAVPQCSSPLVIRVVADGTYILTVFAVDKAGNKSNPIDYRWTVDNSPPPVALLTPENGGRVNVRKPVFTGTSEPLASVRVFLKDPQGLESSAGVASTSASGSWSLESTVNVFNGTYSARAVATDLAGNSNETAVISFIVDTDPPETEILSGPPNPHNSRLVSFVVRSPENVTQFLCTLDAVGPFDCKAEDCSPNVTDIQSCFFFNLSTTGTKRVDGDHILTVRAKDPAGNIDPTPEPYSWTVIIRPPQPPQIEQPTEGEVVFELTPTIRGTTESKGKVACYLGDTDTKLGIAEANEAGEWSFKPSQEMEEGSYSLRCDVTDSAGNPSETMSRVSFSVVPPKQQAQAIGGGLGCSSSGGSLGVTLLGLLSGVLWTSRRRRR